MIQAYFFNNCDFDIKIPSYFLLQHLSLKLHLLKTYSLEDRRQNFFTDSMGLFPLLARDILFVEVPKYSSMFQERDSNKDLDS